jgi:hypothetical protein
MRPSRAAKRENWVSGLVRRWAGCGCARARRSLLLRRGRRGAGVSVPWIGHPCRAGPRGDHPRHWMVDPHAPLPRILRNHIIPLACGGNRCPPLSTERARVHSETAAYPRISTVRVFGGVGVDTVRDESETGCNENETSSGARGLCGGSGRRTGYEVIFGRNAPVLRGRLGGFAGEPEPVGGAAFGGLGASGSAGSWGGGRAEARGRQSRSALAAGGAGWFRRDAPEGEGAARCAPYEQRACRRRAERVDATRSRRS